MRVASSHAFESSLSNLQRRQEALTKAQEQLTSGKRVLKPSDDPSAAATAERALAASRRADAQMRALDASKTAMELTESALGDAGELVQQARELLISAGNGSYTDSERKTIADAVQGLRQDLLAVANRKDGAGRYLFGGQGSAGAPLVDGPTGVTYAGSGGQSVAAAGEATPLTMNGQAIWLQAPDPSSPGSTLSLFDAMDQVVSDLQTPGRTAAQTALTVSTGLGQFDAARENLSAAQARAGQALSRIDGISLRLSQTKLDAQSQQSDAEDLDMLQAISDFQARQTGYDAALKTYSMVQQMSLFQYIK